MTAPYVLVSLVFALAVSAGEPSWLDDYIEYHRQTRLDPHARYLVYECNGFCGGIGDRVKGIVTAFYAAVITRRVFLLRSTVPKDLSAYLIPNRIDWTWPRLLKQTCDERHREIDRIPQWLNRIRDADIWAPKQIVCISSNLYAKVMHVLLNKTTLFQDSLSRPPSAFVGTAFRALFRPSAGVWSRIQHIVNETGIPPVVPDLFLQQPREFWIAAHARDVHGKHPDANFRRPANQHIYNNKTVGNLINCLETLLSRRKATVYVTSDSFVAKTVIAARVPTAVFTTTPILHFDHQRNVDHTWTWAEFLLIGHASCVVSAHYSGFSMIASYLRERLDDSGVRCFIMEADQLTCTRWSSSLVSTTEVLMHMVQPRHVTHCLIDLRVAGGWKHLEIRSCQIALCAAFC